MDKHQPSILKNGKYLKIPPAIYEGAISSVYEGLEIKPKNKIAIKEFSSGLKTIQELRDSFGRDLGALQKLKHQNILKVIDFSDGLNEEDDTDYPYLILEFKDKNLKEFKDKNPDSFKDWDSVYESFLQPILSAISHAHRHNIVHRDIKPDNILMSAGSPVVSDFGIAKIYDRLFESNITFDNYTSYPFTKSDGSKSYQIDVRSFGILCIWCMSDEIYRADITDREIHQILEGLDISQAAKDVIKKCISNPEDRFINAIALESELNATYSKEKATENTAVLDCAFFNIWVIKNKIADEIGCTIKDSAAIEDYIRKDLSASPSVFHSKGKEGERLYCVVGEQWAYTCVVDRDEFKAIGCTLNLPQTQARLRKDKPHLPIKLEPFIDDKPQIGQVLPGEIARDRIDEAIINYRKGEKAYKDDADQSIHKWKRLADAKHEYIQDYLRQLTYSSLVFEDNLVKVRYTELTSKSEEDYIEEVEESQNTLTADNIEVGSILKGKIQKINNNGIKVDLNIPYKIGFCALEELPEKYIEKVPIEIGSTIYGAIKPKTNELGGFTEEINIDAIPGRTATCRISNLPEIFVREVEDPLRPGRVFKGIIDGTASFGAFINLAPGFVGLLHISKITGKYIEDIDEFCQPGGEIEVVILDVDGSRYKLSALKKDIDKAEKEPKRERKLKLNSQHLPSEEIPFVIINIDDSGNIELSGKGIDGTNPSDKTKKPDNKEGSRESNSDTFSRVNHNKLKVTDELPFKVIERLPASDLFLHNLTARLSKQESPKSRKPVETKKPKVYDETVYEFLNKDKWQIKRRAHFELFKVSGKELWFKPINEISAGIVDSLPTEGYIKEVDPGSFANIRREQEGLDKLNAGDSLRQDLRSLITDPNSARRIDENPEKQKEFQAKYAPFDESQARSLDKVLRNDGFSIVHGPPGTGKTTFIANLISETLEKKPTAKILLSSPTHTAIDNAIEKILAKDNQIKILRIVGKRHETKKKLSKQASLLTYERRIPEWTNDIKNKCNNFYDKFANDAHLRLQKFNESINNQTTANSFEQDDEQLLNELRHLQESWVDRIGKPEEDFVKALCMSSDIVAGTCQGYNSIPGTKDLEYDLCIIDEAAKAEAIEAILPLLNSRKWILVGDNKQLPPMDADVLKNEKYKDDFNLHDSDIDEPLFDRLTNSLPETSVSELSHQYRMAQPIGELISASFYDGKLETGRTTEPIKELSNLFADNDNQKVNAIWLSTENDTKKEERQNEGSNSYFNTNERNRIGELLVKINDSIKDIKGKINVCCISGYADQTQLLKQLTDTKAKSLNNLNVSCQNIDAVQGREYDVVIFSVVRSNAKQDSGFMKRFRRVNVACSRAKDLLIIVGDAKFADTMNMHNPLRKILRNIKKISGCELRVDI